MTDPKTRALELVDGLVACAPPVGWRQRLAAERAAALRLAITQIPTTSWQPMEAAPVGGDPVRLLVENPRSKRRSVIKAQKQELDGSWWDAERGQTLSDYWTPLAWRHADSTELPEDAGQLETMPHLFPNEARQAGEHKATHVWVPIGECGKLAQGRYRVKCEDDRAGHIYEADGFLEHDGWACRNVVNIKRHHPDAGLRILAVLSPHLGPIPEAP